MYIQNNLRLSWSAVKSQRLKKLRRISFEEIVQARLIGIIEHLIRPNQRILLYVYKGYVWAVPCVYKEDGGLFLKTIYPSRKFTKIYGKDL